MCAERNLPLMWPMGIITASCGNHTLQEGLYVSYAMSVRCSSGCKPVGRNRPRVPASFVAAWFPHLSIMLQLLHATSSDIYTDQLDVAVSGP
eukprot:48981-Eustigmatos_ZCMA.PRE.1